MIKTNGSSCHHLIALHIGSTGGEQICLNCPEPRCLLNAEYSHKALIERDEKIDQLLKEGVATHVIVRRLHISRNTVYQRSKRLTKGKGA